MGGINFEVFINFDIVKCVTHDYTDYTKNYSCYFIHNTKAVIAITKREAFSPVGPNSRSEVAIKMAF